MMQKNKLMLLGAVLVPLCISAADKTIRFEAENVLAPGITVKTNKPSSKNWDIWTNDPNNKVWSDGKVLRLIRMAKKSLPVTQNPPNSNHQLTIGLHSFLR